MKRYLYLIVGFVLIFSLMYGVAEWLHISWLTDPSAKMQSNRWWAAIIGSTLLVLDVVLPVPSSIVMGVNGQLFGVAMGTLVSLVGSMASAVIGFWMGRSGGPLLDRIVSPEERRRADRMLKRYGPLAVIVSRPVPMLAEVMTILAGTSHMTWPTFLVSALLGSLPMCYLFSLAGEQANLAVMFGAVIGLAAVFWFIGRWVMRSPEPVQPAEEAKRTTL